MPIYQLPPATPVWNSIPATAYSLEESLLPSPFEKALKLDLDIESINSNYKLPERLGTFTVKEAFSPDLSIGDTYMREFPVYGIWKDESR